MASVLSVGVRQGLVSVFLRDRRCVSMIWGANRRGFGEEDVESIGWGNGRLLDVRESGDGSCGVLSLLGLRECLIFVSTGWGKARRALAPLAGASAEGGLGNDDAGASLVRGDGDFGDEGGEWGGMAINGASIGGGWQLDHFNCMLTV